MTQKGMQMTRPMILAAALLAAGPLHAQTAAPQPAPAAAPTAPMTAPAPTAGSAPTDATVPAAPPPVTTAEPAPTDMPGTAPAAGDTIERIAYSCDGGKMMDAIFVNTASGSSFAVVSHNDELIPMQVAVSASGARYVPVNVNQTYELLTKGDDATLYEDQDTVIAENCAAQR